MDSKRKANGGAAAEADDRSTKRRKTAQDFDLTKGETRESTTVYGYNFLEQIRRTADKSGRRVATYFETLPPREGNADYYRRTLLPISLETIEAKLDNNEFSSLSELESYAKRMISNAKEYYPRTSSTFDDAERVRKALSNYMTKTNPAYRIAGYSALPTPLPGDGEGADEDEDEQQEDDEGGDEDAEGEDEEEDEDNDSRDKRPNIILKSRPRPQTRVSRNSTSFVQESPRTPATPGRPDHQYEDVPYKGLNFQQAQEKVVEELLRHQDPDYDDAYFEPFINLPPRSLKDYYKVVTDPLSIKKLQKSVKGVQGRNDATGVTEFKSWSAFEEKAQLLWNNAYFYNEETSDIYSLAQELEEFFETEVKQAKEAVHEPTQPKIKLKVGQADPSSTAKKITIHVSGRGGSNESPAPQNGQPDDSPADGATMNGITRLGLADKARSVSASAASPSPMVQPGFKAEDTAHMSPAGLTHPLLTTPAQAGIGMPGQPVPPAQPQPGQLMTGFLEQKAHRADGKGVKDALMTSLRIQLHPSVQTERSTVVTVLPHAREMQQSAAINLPSNLNRVHVVLELPEFLHDRQYSLWMMVDRQPLKQSMQLLPNQQLQERAFEILLHHGVNVIESHLVAAVPRSERVPGEPEAEVEVFTVLVNLMSS